MPHTAQGMSGISEVLDGIEPRCSRGGNGAGEEHGHNEKSDLDQLPPPFCTTKYRLPMPSLAFPLSVTTHAIVWSPFDSLVVSR